MKKIVKMLIILMMTGPTQKMEVRDLRRISRGNIAYLPASSVKKISCIIANTVQQNIKIWLDVSYPVMRVMMDNLESNDSSLVAAAKRLKIISYKYAHAADVLYRQRCYKFTRDYKSAMSNREAKGSVIKTTLGTWRIITLSYRVLNKNFFLHTNSQRPTEWGLV